MAWGRSKAITPEPITDIDLERLNDLVDRLEAGVARLATERKQLTTEVGRLERLRRGGK